jgi:hypothetical protein
MGGLIFNLLEKQFRKLLKFKNNNENKEVVYKRNK